MATGLFMHRSHNQGRAFAAFKAQQAKRNLDNFAEALAEFGTVTAAARHCGISQQRGSQLLARIRAKLGWQAQ